MKMFWKYAELKITMVKDVLRCQIPEMIRKEILMSFIAYNCVRRVTFEAAEKAELPVRTDRSKGNLKTIRRRIPQFSREKLSKAERSKLLNDLYGTMTSLLLSQRSGRGESRC